jgi:putative transposase
MRRLKQLEDENAKLKRIVADLSLDMSTASVEWVVSIRRACRVFEVDTSTYHCKSRRPEQASLEARIREICQTRVRYGYRRVHVLLRREGWLACPEHPDRFSHHLCGLS